MTRALQEAEQRQRQNYQNAYSQALSQPGDIHASAFRGIGQRIQQDLSNSTNPVIIDDVTAADERAAFARRKAFMTEDELFRYNTSGRSRDHRAWFYNTSRGRRRIFPRDFL